MYEAKTKKWKNKDKESNKWNRIELNRILKSSLSILSRREVIQIQTICKRLAVVILITF